jgi:hypothetical protein
VHQRMLALLQAAVLDTRCAVNVWSQQERPRVEWSRTLPFVDENILQNLMASLRVIR